MTELDKLTPRRALLTAQKLCRLHKLPLEIESLISITRSDAIHTPGMGMVLVVELTAALASHGIEWEDGERWIDHCASHATYEAPNKGSTHDYGKVLPHARQRWIPCAHGLPPEGVPVLAWLAGTEWLESGLEILIREPASWHSREGSMEFPLDRVICWAAIQPPTL